jgi:hypothetical protein
VASLSVVGEEKTIVATDSCWDGVDGDCGSSETESGSDLGVGAGEDSFSAAVGWCDVGDCDRGCCFWSSITAADFWAFFACVLTLARLEMVRWNKCHDQLLNQCHIK